MPGALNHSPADILRQLIVDIGAGVAPTVASTTDWQTYVGMEPDERSGAEQVITVTNTAGVPKGRVGQGERQIFHGANLRIRAKTHATGYVKANATAILLDSVYQRDVVIGGTTYLVHSVNRQGDILDLGKGDTPNNRYTFFSINVLFVTDKRPLT